MGGRGGGGQRQAHPLLVLCTHRFAERGVEGPGEESQEQAGQQYQRYVHTRKLQKGGEGKALVTVTH